MLSGAKKIPFTYVSGIFQRGGTQPLTSISRAK